MRETALEHWLRDEVAKSYDELAAAPDTAIFLDEVLPRIRANYAQSMAKATGK